MQEINYLLKCIVRPDVYMSRCVAYIMIAISAVALQSCDNSVDGDIYYPLPYEVTGAKFSDKGQGILYADIPSTGTTVVWSMQPDNKYINLSTYLVYAKSASSLEQLFSSPTIENPHPYNVDLHFDATSAEEFWREHESIEVGWGVILCEGDKWSPTKILFYPNTTGSTRFIELTFGADYWFSKYVLIQPPV